VRKDIKTVVTATERKNSQEANSKTPEPRTMSLQKAKKLIRKTSDEHEGLFRRLAR
jgi:hypothetical protein